MTALALAQRAAEAGDLAGFHAAVALAGLSDLEAARVMATDDKGQVDLAKMDQILGIAEKRQRILVRSGEALVRARHGGYKVGARKPPTVAGETAPVEEKLPEPPVDNPWAVKQERLSGRALRAVGDES